MTAKIFLLCFVAGLISGTAEGFLEPLRKSAGVVFGIITDVLLAFAFVALHALIMYFYCNGRLFAYAVIAQIIGFILARIAIIKLLSPVLKFIEKKSANVAKENLKESTIPNKEMRIAKKKKKYAKANKLA